MNLNEMNVIISFYNILKNVQITPEHIFYAVFHKMKSNIDTDIIEIHSLGTVVCFIKIKLKLLSAIPKLRECVCKMVCTAKFWTFGKRQKEAFGSILYFMNFAVHTITLAFPWFHQ